MDVMAEFLGPVRLLVNGTSIDLGGARQRRLLSVLLAERGTVVSTDRLIEAVFEGEPSDAARATFRTYVARLRRALDAAGVDGAEVIVTAPPGYRIESSAMALDSASFEEGVRHAEDRLAVGDTDGAVLTVEAALALWRGEAYGEFAEEEWARPEAVRLEQRRLAARELRVEALVESGRHDAAIPEAEALVAQEPFRERPRRLLMVAMYRSGRHAEALRCGHEFRSFLAEEAGLETTGDLAELEQMIIECDPRLDARPRGRRLRGYLLAEPVRESPLGITYRASQPSVGRDVAITVVPAEQADDPAFVRRFEVHAQRIAAIEHPNVVPLYDYWREPGGAYLAARYLPGGSLEERLDATSTWSVADVVRIVTDVGAALTAAHARGVAHGGLVPGSILFDETGTAHLAEFGLGADLRSMPDDIEALAGLAEAMWQRTSASESRPPTVAVAASVESVVRRACAPEPQLGYASVGEFVEDFAGALRAGASGDAGTVAGREPRPLIEGPNPYRGLYAFNETDAEVFFGREVLVSELVSHLTRAPFVAVVGPSGSGKSSTVRAGLLPRLRAAGAIVATMSPGTRPVAELEVALTRVAAAPVPDLPDLLRDDAGALARSLRDVLSDDSPLVLVVDQFEEAFTISDAADRDLLLAGLCHALDRGNGQLRVVVTARADFLGPILDHRLIGEQVRDNTRLVAPLSADELHEAIVEPAAGVGVAVEPALVSALVADATGEPGSLPLLQFALTELYEHRVEGTMTLDAYERLGRLTSVLSQRADEIYAGLAMEDQEASRRLFSRLITPGEGAADTRRRALRTELATVPTTLLEVYGRVRLLSFDRDPLTREPTVEVAHEALIGEWPRLRAWVDEDREGLRALRHLSVATAEWEAKDCDAGELYHGSRLAAAEEWAAYHPGELSPAEAAFLEASRDARDAHARHERRQVRRLRLLAVSVGLIALVAIVAGFVALRQRQAADDNAAEAERRALENRTAQLSSEAMLALGSEDPDLAILLALAAYETSTELSETPSPGVVTALHETVQASGLERVLPAGRAEIAISPDGRHVALDHPQSQGHLFVYDIDTGGLVADRRVGESIGGLAYSPDGSLLAMAFCCTTNADRGPDLPAMLLVDPTTLETVQELDGGHATSFPSWSADGRSVLAMGLQGRGARLWDAARPEVRRTVARPDAVASMFVPGTNDIAVVTPGTLEIVDRYSGDIRSSHEAPDPVNGAQFSADGAMVAFADWSGRMVHVVPLGSDQPPIEIDDPTPQDVRFSPDGTAVSIAGNADAIRVVDLASGETLELRGHGTGSWRHAFTPDGDRLLATSLDGGTRIWDLEPAGPEALGNLTASGPAVNATGSADGSILVAAQTGADVARIEAIDRRDGSRRTVTELLFEVWDRPVFSPDGSLTGGYTIEELVPSVIDVATGRVILTLPECESPRAIDARNRWVLVDGFTCPDAFQGPQPTNRRTGFVDLDTGDLLAPVRDPNGVAEAVLGPPGTIAADLFAYHTSTHVIFGRASTREILTVWHVPEGVTPLSAAMSPDGSMVGVSAQTGQGIVFDVQAILDGASADDAVTIYGDLSAGPTHRAVPIGDSIVTSGGGTQIRQWDTESGSLLADVTTNPGRSAFLFAVPSDDDSVYYQDAGGVIRRFPINTGDLVALARSRVQRGFTDTECHRYFPPGDCPTVISNQ